jgi:DNA-binding beta-propeller fold protein YncE
VYVDAPLANRIVTYSYDNTGALHFQGFVENPGGFTPCWNRVTSDGRYMYVSNTNSGNISVFSLANPARPQQIQLVAPFGGGGPNSIELDPRGKLLFALAGHDDPDSPDLSPFADGNVVHTFRIGADGKLSEFPARPAFLPLPTGDKPEGIATLGL